MDLNQKLEDLELKVKQLIQYNQQLRHEVEELGNKKEALQGRLAKEQTESKKLKAQLAEQKGMTVRDYQSEVKSAKKLHQQIERYIKDIDQCIEWLQHS